MRERDEVQTAHETHTLGLFSREAWTRLLEGAGYAVSTTERWVDGVLYDRVFVCRKP